MNSYSEKNTLAITEQDAQKEHAKKVNSRDGFWNSVSIEVTINPDTNRPQAVVSVSPADLDYLKTARQKLKSKIATRQNFTLKGKVTISTLKNYQEMFIAHGKYCFIITLNDDSITKEEFEIYLNSVKTDQSRQIKLPRHTLISQL